MLRLCVLKLAHQVINPVRIPIIAMPEPKWPLYRVVEKRVKLLWQFDFSWCCRRDLNSRPLPYQGSALPLSYGSICKVRGAGAGCGDTYAKAGKNFPLTMWPVLGQHPLTEAGAHCHNALNRARRKPRLFFAVQRCAPGRPVAAFCGCDDVTFWPRNLGSGKN